MDIAQNMQNVRERIEKVARASGRTGAEITLVGVSKTVSAGLIREAVAAGLSDLGENRVQEYMEKAGELAETGARWHIIGHLQSNKAKYVAGKVALIQSLDSLELAAVISAKAAALGKIQDVLVQVNASGEDTKSGIGPDEVERFLLEARKFENIRIKGLMTIGPLTTDLSLIDKVFESMHKKYIDIKRQNIDNIYMEHLSMGMSGDFEAAISRGSNMVRIGSAIFGERR